MDQKHPECWSPRDPQTPAGAQKVNSSCDSETKIEEKDVKFNPAESNCEEGKFHTLYEYIHYFIQKEQTPQSIRTVDELIQLFNQLQWKKNHFYPFRKTIKKPQN